MIQPRINMAVSRKFIKKMVGKHLHMHFGKHLSSDLFQLIFTFFPFLTIFDNFRIFSTI